MVLIGIIRTKSLLLEMKAEDKFWSGGKIYWCTHNLSNKDKIVFWGNPKTKEVVKIFRYILIKTIDRRKVFCLKNRSCIKQSLNEASLMH